MEKGWDINFLLLGLVNVKYDDCFSKNFKYVKILISNDKDIYFIILNNSVLKYDGIIIRELYFYVLFWVLFFDDIVVVYKWIYDI